VFKSETGDLDAARADQEETLALSRAAGDNYRLVITLGNLGVDELVAGKLAAARAHLQEASTLASSRGYQILSAGRQNLGFVDLIDADPRSARRHFIDSLDTARITGFKSYVHGALLGLALAASADGDTTVAATLHGVADQQAGRSFQALEAGLRDRDHTRLRATLGEAAFEAAYRHGRTLNQADAITLARAASQPDPEDAPTATLPSAPAASPATPRGSADLLSQREREIVALLAGGATDTQIARQLYLSVNTVRSHLERIRDKTGARRRTELARYALQAGIGPVAPPT
jgi:DNA-binding NarL/FixJ family response regulator